MSGGAANRLIVLDVLRGAAVAGMILVTSPGEWNDAYAPLRHAEWNGWTLADMVFPTFLFTVGMTLGLSFPRALSTPDARARLWRRVARRAAGLILLGLALNAVYTIAVPGIPVYIGHPGLAFVRIPGVLQRIAICYIGAVAMILGFARKTPDGKLDINPRALAAAIVAMLLLYWALMRFVPVPGYGVGQLDPEGNLAAYIDRAVFTPRHMWPLGSVNWGGPVVYDPEGLLSTVPAMTNTLIGVLAGWAWRRDARAAVPRIAIAGIALMATALLLDPLFPINKKIWTSSFALLSGGFSLLALAALGLLLRSAMAERLAMPFRVLGGNAVLAFSVSILLTKFSGAPWFRWNGETVTAQKWGDEVARNLIPDIHVASLACALAILAIVTLPLWPLHRRAIHFRL